MQGLGEYNVYYIANILHGCTTYSNRAYSLHIILYTTVPSNQARSQSLVMDGFPSIVQRMATNRPMSDISAAPNAGIPVCYCGALCNLKIDYFITEFQ